MRHTLLLFLLPAYLTLAGATPPAPPDAAQRCDPIPITMPRCRSMAYNYTGMPNLVGHETEMDARIDIETFASLLKSGCSKRLHFLLCSIYTPMCDPTSLLLVGPCRGLCEHVRARCEPIMTTFSILWPRHLDCSRFPSRNEPDSLMCMDGPLEDESGELPSRADALAAVAEATQATANAEKARQRALADFSNKLRGEGQNQEPIEVDYSPVSGGPCGHLQGVPPSVRIYVNRTSRCGLTCAPRDQSKVNDNTRTGLYTMGQRNLAMRVTIALCILCILGGLGVLLTGLMVISVDPQLHRSQAPRCQRTNNEVASQQGDKATWWDWCGVGPIAHKRLVRILGWLAFCQLCNSLAYILRLSYGHQTSACDKAKEVLLQDGLDNPVCALTFLLHYFFLNASLGWWFALCIVWTSEVCRQASMLTSITASSPRGSFGSARLLNLATRLSAWRGAYDDRAHGAGGIREHVWCHVIGWTPAGLLTASVLVLRAVEASELLGVCDLGLYRHRQFLAPFSNPSNNEETTQYRVVLGLALSPGILTLVGAGMVLGYSSLLLFTLWMMEGASKQTNRFIDGTTPLSNTAEFIALHAQEPTALFNGCSTNSDVTNSSSNMDPNRLGMQQRDQPFSRGTSAFSGLSKDVSQRQPTYRAAYATVYGTSLASIGATVPPTASVVSPTSSQ